MKGIATICLVTVFGLVPLTQVAAQEKSLASTMDVYVFPTEGQDASTQSKDEAACYEWAVGNAGVDPFARKQTLKKCKRTAPSGR